MRTSPSNLISPGDELVSSVTLYRLRHWSLHGHIGPFFVLYAAWAYLWTIHFGVEGNLEPGMIAFAAIAMLQILLSLSCYWSVHVLGFLTCSQVRLPSVFGGNINEDFKIRNIFKVYI